MQQATEASNAEQARALATEAIQTARAALGQSAAGGVKVEPMGERILISVPSEDGARRVIEISADGKQVLAVEGMSTRAIAPRKQIPGEVIPIMAIIFGSVTVMTLFTPLIKAFARRFEKRAEVRQQALSDQRLAAIEQAIEAVAVEVERISEGQRFTTKLLADRAQPDMERVR